MLEAEVVRSEFGADRAMERSRTTDASVPTRDVVHVENGPSSSKSSQKLGAVVRLEQYRPVSPAASLAASRAESNGEPSPRGASPAGASPASADAPPLRPSKDVVNQHWMAPTPRPTTMTNAETKQVVTRGCNPSA